MMLCHECSSIEIALPADDRVLRIYHNVVTLQRGATQGCDLCILLQKSHSEVHTRSFAARREPHPNHLEHSPITVSYSKDIEIDLESNISWSCCQEWKGGSSTLRGKLGGFFADINDPSTAEIRGREVSLDPMSDQTMSSVVAWLGTCVNMHTNCPKTYANSLPTRLIDVGHDISASTVRLVEPTKGIVGCYIALSYCWGSTNHGVLTLANIVSRRRCLSLFGQPKTISDAVLIARRLHVQYLWVDSLCIIQDSNEDWDREAATMCDVYSNAYLTIQASRCAESGEGFLRPRLPNQSAKLPYKTQSGSRGFVSVRSRLLVDPSLEEPLYRRGWTFQEALLSPRILSFGATETSWECNTCFASEGGSSMWDAEAFVGLPKPIRRKTISHFLPPGLQLNDFRIKQRVTWSFIISEYSGRMLTFEKDKLLALAGLARQVARNRPKDEYVAGLWKSDLPEDLMYGFQSKPSRTMLYRAPSWSWASKNGHLASFDANYGRAAGYCTVLDVTVTLAGPDRFGAVVSGILTVRAQMMEGWRILDESAQESGDRVQFFYETPRDLRAEYSPYRLKFGLCELDSHDEQQSLYVPVLNYFMRIFEDAGLVLHRLLDGSYERIGTFYVDEGKETWFGSCPYTNINIV